jgi:maltose alpha-D-glucosyltransferase / alpha-amylase
MLLAEANQWPEDAAEYFGDGDECHMNFHFPLMPRLFMAVRMEDRFPIIDILAADPGDPRRLPVGAVPAQPRRAHARDGHRRGARLHVPRVRGTTRGCASTSASAAGSRRCSATTGARSS